jgi:hypothetical protein
LVDVYLTPVAIDSKAELDGNRLAARPGLYLQAMDNAGSVQSLNVMPVFPSGYSCSSMKRQ